MNITKIEVLNNIGDRKIKILELDKNSLLRCVKLSVYAGVVKILSDYYGNEKLSTAGLVSVILYATYAGYKIIKNSKKVNKLMEETANDKFNHVVPITEFKGKVVNISLLVDENNDIYCNYEGKLISKDGYQRSITRHVLFI